MTTARTPRCHFGARPQERSATQICVQFQNSSAPPRISLAPPFPPQPNTDNTSSVSRYSSRVPVGVRKHLPPPPPAPRRWKANVFRSFLLNQVSDENIWWGKMPFCVYPKEDICPLKPNQSGGPTQGSTSRIFPLMVLMKRRPWQAL